MQIDKQKLLDYVNEEIIHFESMFGDENSGLERYAWGQQVLTLKSLRDTVHSGELDAETN